MIVGAGYAGVELATVVAERMKGKARVQLVTPNSDVLDGCPEGQRIAASRTLASLGVEIITGRSSIVCRGAQLLDHDAAYT
jgi:NADH dehydrogenase FAD-containing subunit